MKYSIICVNHQYVVTDKFVSCRIPVYASSYDKNKMDAECKKLNDDTAKFLEILEIVGM